MQNLLLARSIHLFYLGCSGPQNYFRRCILQVVNTIGQQMVDVLAYRRPPEPEMLCCISSPALMKAYDQNFSHLLSIQLAKYFGEIMVGTARLKYNKTVACSGGLWAAKQVELFGLMLKGLYQIIVRFVKLHSYTKQTHLLWANWQLFQRIMGHPRSVTGTRCWHKEQQKILDFGSIIVQRVKRQNNLSFLLSVAKNVIKFVIKNLSWKICGHRI